MGFGWALALLVVSLVIWLLAVGRQPNRSLVGEFKQNAMIWLLAAAAIVFLLPSIEIRSVTGEPLGIAVRGYGVFLLAGVSAGVGLAIYRAHRFAMSTDAVLALAFWLLIGGIVGARAFYVVEYWDDFVEGTWKSTLFRVLDFTRGGLVVYGSIIGGALAAAAFCWRYRLKALRIGDIIIPSLFLGIFFGRLGCLMNGCCYAGRCEDSVWATYFPPGSPVYMEQMESGELLGLTLLATEVPSQGDLDEPDARFVAARRVERVVPGSLADRAGIRVGASVQQIYPATPPPERLDPAMPVDDASGVDWIAIVDGQMMRWQASELPARALAVRSAQLLSSVNGLWICCLLLTISAFVPLRTGVLTALGFAIYAIVRFIEENVRSDEPGQFGTQLTIAQWVSLLILPLALGTIIWIYRRPKGGLSSSSGPNSGTGVSD